MGLAKNKQPLMHERMKALYIEGKSVKEISVMCKVSPQAVYQRRKKELEFGVDWDELALSHARDNSGTKMSEKEFITTLIKGFELDFERLKELEPSESLELLAKYSTTYYKLKSPSKSDCRELMLNAINKTILSISDLSIRENNKSVIEFLSSNADNIVEMVLKK